MTDFAQRYFEDVNVGDQFEETQQPTHDHVVSFIAAAGLPDGGGRFTDPEIGRAHV